ncbi:MAG: hypothetical protein JWO42_399 [Chloroflexi bacterium]|nr:hypothetical protein [Chloroflexota bacterium]
MQARQLMRVGAICGFLYVALIVATQVYLSRQPLPSTKATQTSEQADRIFLIFVHQHQSVFGVAAVMALAGFVLLGVVAAALRTVLARPGLLVPRITFLVGLVSLMLSAVAVILGYIDLGNYAQQLVNAHTPAQIHTVLHAYSNGYYRDVGLERIGLLGVAIWLGLVGATLIRINGRGSVAGWSSIAACVLAGLGLPVLIAWSAGAGVGLWRLSRPDIEPDAPVVEPVPQRGRTPRPGSVRTVTPEVEPAETEAVATAPAAAPARPPRGTSEPRHQPAPAKGSKSARPRKRR